MTINWTTIIITAFIALLLLFTPSPINWGCNNRSVDTVIVHDTSYVTSSNIVFVTKKPATSIPTFTPTPVKRDSLIMPSFLEVEMKDSVIDGNKVSIRARLYPFIQNDSLKGDMSIEANIQPKPAQVITTTKTITKEVSVPADPPFYEKPSFVFPLGVVVGAAAVLTIIKQIK
jgi:hypothetical protein